MAASRYRRDFAEDLAQEVFVVLEEKYAQVTSLEELLPLAFEILRFKMMGWRNKAIRRGENTAVDVTEFPIADRTEGQDVLLDRQRRLERLTAALGQLGERCQKMFRWKLEGKGFPEIQKLFGADSINTIYTWDSRCRKELQAKMEDMGSGQ